jgi:hypothetical protein
LRKKYTSQRDLDGSSLVHFAPNDSTERACSKGTGLATSFRMRPTPRTERQSDNRWDRLQRLLAGLKPGEAVTINGVAARTGLGADSIDTVLKALTRADMFAQTNPTTFVRDSYFSLLFALRGSPDPLTYLNSTGPCAQRSSQLSALRYQLTSSG